MLPPACGAAVGSDDVADLTCSRGIPLMPCHAQAAGLTLLTSSHLSQHALSISKIFSLTPHLLTTDIHSFSDCRDPWPAHPQPRGPVCQRQLPLQASSAQLACWHLMSGHTPQLIGTRAASPFRQGALSNRPGTQRRHSPARQRSAQAWGCFRWMQRLAPWGPMERWSSAMAVLRRHPPLRTTASSFRPDHRRPAPADPC